MRNIRTDLALEAREIWQEDAGEQTQLSGVIAREEQVRGHTVHRVKIINQDGAEALGKPIGSYSTVEPVSYTHLDVYKRQRGQCDADYAGRYGLCDTDQKRFDV